MEHVKKNARVPKRGIMIYCPTCKEDILVKHFKNFDAFCYKCKKHYPKTHFLIDPEISIKASKIRKGIYLELNKLTFNNLVINIARKNIFIYSDFVIVRLYENIYTNTLKLKDGKQYCFKNNEASEGIALHFYCEAEERLPNVIRKQKLLKIERNNTQI